MDKYDKLKELKEMLDSGLLEEVEFNNLKNQILFKTETDDESDAELHKKYISDYQINSEKSKKMSTSAIILYTIIGIVLFAFMKGTFFKKEEPIQITTDGKDRSAELERNNYTNENSEMDDNTIQSNSYQNNNSNMNNNGYHMGRDGRVYENNACSLCKGIGIETGRNIATGELEGRICPMCDGRGVRSY